jgi:hypothetical protein
MADVIQEWTGWVDQVRRKWFTARLADVTAGVPYATECMDIRIDDLTPAERPYLRAGAYLTVKVTSDEKVRVRFSRRRWTKRMLDHAQRQAERLSKSLNWE